MKQDLFISYCWKDGLYYADELQSELEGQFNILRDKIQANSDDIYEYMSQCEACDNVVIVLTDAYLHSLNCMLEVSFLMDGENWADRMTLLVLYQEIYGSDAKLEVVEYWHQRQMELDAKISAATSGKRLLAEEKQQVDAVVNTVEEFLEKVAHLKNPSQIAVASEIRRKAKAHLIPQNLTDLREEIGDEIKDGITRKSKEIREFEMKSMEERRDKVRKFLEKHAAK